MPPALPRTPRLQLHELTPGDAGFIVELLNDPDFLRHIGDRQVRTADDARAYLAAGPMASYAAHGFGLWRVELTATGESVGMCGLLRRPTLPDADLGYAFLPAFRGQGLASEAAAATLRFGFEQAGLPRILAIVSPGNAGSIRLLEKLGLAFDRMQVIGDDELRVHALDAAAWRAAT